MLGVLLVLSCSSYSYSDTIYGTTGNAATTGTSAGYNWVMQNILPQQAGLAVTSVTYRYTAVKDPESDMIVYVQNEDAMNPGEYIFREVDDWSGLEGKSIFKTLPQNNVLIGRWGNGSIEVEGEGSVEDANVFYNYKYDPCFDPQTSPECPGYVPVLPDIPQVDLSEYYDQEQQFIDEDMKSKEAEVEEQEQKELDRKRSIKKERLKERLQFAMSAGANALEISGDAQLKHQQLVAYSTNMINNYAAVTIQGGLYKDTVVLKDGKIPVNIKARRVSFAQQLLHEEMVQSQYKEKGER